MAALAPSMAARRLIGGEIGHASAAFRDPKCILLSGAVTRG
jgi:hypothetical protein